MAISCSLADMQSGEAGAEVRRALRKIVGKKVVTKDGADSSSTTIGSDKKKLFRKKKGRLIAPQFGK